VTYAELARTGVGTGVGADVGAGVGAGVGVGVGADVGAGADASIASVWTPDVSAPGVSVVPDSDGGSSGGGVSVTPITTVSLVAVDAVTGRLVHCLLSRLSFPVPRSGVKSDLTRPQQMMSNTVVTLNCHLLAR
jgi:hypothetical protein